jgi:hypothetical protein
LHAPLTEDESMLALLLVPPLTIPFPRQHLLT